MSYLTDGCLRLRALEPQDLEIVYQIENDSDLWGCSNTNVPYSRYAIKRFIAEASNDIYSDRQVRLVAEQVSDGVPVGFADLVDFSPRHMRAEVGIVVFPGFRGRGYGKAILDMLEKYSRSSLLLHNIYAVVSVDNKAAVRLFKAAGFDFKAVLDGWLAGAEGYGGAWICQKTLNDNDTRN